MKSPAHQHPHFVCDECGTVECLEASQHPQELRPVPPRRVAVRGAGTRKSCCTGCARSATSEPPLPSERSTVRNSRADSRVIDNGAKPHYLFASDLHLGIADSRWACTCTNLAKRYVAPDGSAVPVIDVDAVRPRRRRAGRPRRRQRDGQDHAAAPDRRHPHARQRADRFRQRSTAQRPASHRHRPLSAKPRATSSAAATSATSSRRTTCCPASPRWRTCCSA